MEFQLRNDMPHFTINQHYRGLESFRVEAPDAKTALAWLTDGKPGDDDYPGERHRDEYIEVEGREVFETQGALVLTEGYQPTTLMARWIDWVPVGDHYDGADQLCRLKATVMIGRLAMHLEALQPGVNAEIDLMITEAARLTGAGGKFKTLLIDGRQYVLIATPYEV
jgi:hypothetical protein